MTHFWVFQCTIFVRSAAAHVLSLLHVLLHHRRSVLQVVLLHVLAVCCVGFWALVLPSRRFGCRSGLPCPEHKTPFVTQSNAKATRQKTSTRTETYDYGCRTRDCSVLAWGETCPSVRSQSKQNRTRDAIEKT